MCLFILLMNMALKLKFLMGSLYVVLNTTFIIAYEVTIVTFKTLNDKSPNPFGFSFQIWHQLTCLFGFELGLVPTQIFLWCRFQISQLLATMLFFGTMNFP